MNYAKLIAAVTALSFVAIGAADAAGKHKRYKPIYRSGAVAFLPAPVYDAQTARPPWAQPWEPRASARSANA